MPGLAAVVCSLKCLKSFDVLAIHQCKGNKTLAMFSAHRWTTPSSIHLLGFEFPTRTTR